MRIPAFRKCLFVIIEIEEYNMTKDKLALEIIERLKKEYPDVGCTLDYDQAWKLLVSVRLAAQ